MNSEILAKLRNVLAKLYPDEASMRRISHDAGLDLARVSLNSSAINNWHSILLESEKLDCVEALLIVVKREYGTNQELLDAYNTYCRLIAMIDWQRLGTEFINDLNKALQYEHKKQEELEEKQKPSLGPDREIQGKIDRLNQKISEVKNFDWLKAEQAYLDKVIKLYDRVRILGSSADIPLGNLFTQVYILDKPTARNRHDIEELRKQADTRVDFQLQPGERIHGLELVKKGQNLFILGKPGAGKTTFLKYIAIQAAQKQLSCVPIFVSLNQWADSRWGKGNAAALLPFLAEQFDICNFPDATLFINYLLQEGKALVLFDGLDEVKQEKDQRRHLTYLLQDFARKYDQSQHLITCRIAANDYAFAGFIDVEVADFTAEQIREYARNWFGTQEKKFDAFVVELAKPENFGLTELCNTPLLLSLLCLTFDNVMRFPPNRVELYEDALETLLRKWDSSRQIQRDEIYRMLSYKRKLKLLMRIAHPAFEKGELFFRRRELEKWIIDYLLTLPDAPPPDTLNPTDLLKSIEAQHSILVERAQDIYSFSHLTFQEYLTARSLAENQDRGVINKLVSEHLTDRRWREVFLLNISLLDDTNEIIDALQQAANSIVADAPNVIHLLGWAQKRTKEANTPSTRRIVVHLAYIFLALSITVAIALVYTRSLSRDLDRALVFDFTLALAQDINVTLERVRDLELAPELELALARVFARTLALDRDIVISEGLASERELDQALARVNSIENTLTLDLASDITRILGLAHVTAPLIGFDYGLYYVWAYAMLFSNEKLDRTDNKCQAAMHTMPALVECIASLAGEAGLADLAQRLLATVIPLASVDAQAWKQYADILFVILRNKRDLGRKWNLTGKEINKLNNYLYANEVLMQCLKAATVSNRQAILNGLFLPPKTNKSLWSWFGRWLY